MARTLGLGLLQKDARKTGRTSITVQCQNGRRKGLIDEKQSEKAKGIVRSKSRLVSHYGRKQGTAKTEDLHADQMRQRKVGMVRRKSRLVSPYTGRKQGTAKTEDLHADRGRPNKVGIVRSKSRSGDHYKGRKQVVAKAETLHADREMLHELEMGKLNNAMGRKVKRKRSESDESSIVDEQQKIGMRDIRLDPNDITNKRLVEDIPTTVSKEIKRQETQVSKNAQFRTIRPSPTILSHINDNLLGRRRLTELKDAGYNIKLSAPLDNVPFSKNVERERIEENVFRNKLKFFAAAKVASSFPLADLPEIAFAGRSNVGKSSLLNALTRQWGVVRTSDKPGLTQTINFFKLGSKLCLVDLPGYGFAYAKEEVKESWEDLVKEYVTTRVGLKRVCVLVDTKWGMKPGDQELVNLMERSQTQYQIVLTKTDTVFPMDVARRAMQIQETLKKNKSMVQPMMMVSSKSGAGIRNLRAILAKLSRIVRV